MACVASPRFSGNPLQACSCTWVVASLRGHLIITRRISGFTRGATGLVLSSCPPQSCFLCLLAEMCFKVAPDFSNVVAAWRAAVALATEELQQGRK